METTEILRLATEKDLCKPWQKRMKEDSSLENLCHMYFEGDDWSIENDFPKVEVLRKFKGESDQFGIHTDFKGSLINEPESAFFGNSDVLLDYNYFTVSTLILRHNTKAKISATGNSILFITTLDNVELNVDCVNDAKVTIFNKGSKSITYTGNVTVK